MAKEKQKKPSYDAVMTATFRLLNALARNPELLNDTRITENTFTEETAKSIYLAISSLNDRGLSITPASLLQAGQETDYSITSQIVQTIFDLEQEKVEKVDDILHVLNTAIAKNSLIEKLDLVKNSLLSPGEIDSEYVLNKLYDADKIVQEKDKARTTLLDFNAWADKYIDDLAERKKGRKYPFGDIYLDEIIKRGAAPGSITIVAAGTSMGKSTYILSLMDGLLSQNAACMYLSLEMGTIDTMDRLISKRCGIDSESLYNPEDIDGVIEMVKEEKQNLSGHHKFYFCESSSVDIIKLRALIREFKQKANTDYGVVAIDLLSGMKDFMSGVSNGSTATNIEINMNKLEALAKEENVHIIGVVQIKRENDNIRLDSIEAIEQLRPRLQDLKNSGAYAEKGGLILTVFRKKYYADRYCQGDPAAAALEDILEVQILKDRNGKNAGRILKYMFDGPTFSVKPYESKDDEIDPDNAVDMLSKIQF